MEEGRHALAQHFSSKPKTVKLQEAEHHVICAKTGQDAFVCGKDGFDTIACLLFSPFADSRNCSLLLR